MKKEIIIRIKTEVDGHTFEKLEDRIRDLLEEEGIEAEIEDLYTGNITVTRKQKKQKALVKALVKAYIEEKIEPEQA